MKNNKIKPQRKKEYGRGESVKKKKNNLKKDLNKNINNSKEKINIIDETILFEKR